MFGACSQGCAFPALIAVQCARGVSAIKRQRSDRNGPVGVTGFEPATPTSRT
jgi:hypothetical protein